MFFNISISHCILWNYFLVIHFDLGLWILILMLDHLGKDPDPEPKSYYYQDPEP